MSKLVNCKECGKLFNYIGGVLICPICKMKDEENFEKIKKYLFENPKASISQISNDLEIDVEKIREYLREGRLEFAKNNSLLTLNCSKCGKPINKGLYCRECGEEMSDEFSTIMERMKKSGNFKIENNDFEMKYLSREKKKYR